MSSNRLNRESVRWLLLEGTAIVVSILLAFAIDAWWQDRQDVSKRQQLIAALRSDFEVTYERLVESIERNDGLVDRGLGFWKILDDQADYSLEELGHMVSSISLGVHFKESLTAYRSAVATGDIHLISNLDAVNAIARFLDALEQYENTNEMAGRVFYLGSVWHLRREIGSSTILSYDPDENLGRLQLSEAELRELYSSKLLFAVVENVTLINMNKQRALENMKLASRDILNALDKEK